MQQIRIDFDNPGLPQSLGAVEGERQSRIFQAALYKSGAAYTAPAGAVYSIMYRGFGPQNQGWYDTIEDGAGKRAACIVSGNVVTCELARQALRVPGHLTVVLCVSDAKGYMLKSWPIMADVRNDGYEDTVEVESFFYITQITSAEWTKAFAAWEDFKATIDPSLTLPGKAADAKATGAAVDKLENKKADKTDLDVERKRIDTLNEGGLNLKDDVIDTSIKAWLADHPEATTTVQDGAVTETKIETDFLLEIKDFVTLESFGAKGDGVSDDTEPLKKAVESGRNIKLLDKKIYCVNLVDTLLNINNVTIYCEGQSTIKSIVNASDSGLSNVGFHYCFYLTGKNFTIKNVTFDANSEWVERPIVESGNEWDNYIKKRNSTIGNTKITDSENVNLTNVKFLNGLFSIKISKSSKIKVYGCEFSKTIADSIYITDGTTDAIIENCIAYYNGDDTYCVNVDGSGIPERVTFINCSGHNLYGFLCKVHGGKNVSFVNCSGICQRTGGLSVEAPSESVWGKTTENIIFENCVVKSSGGGAICYSKDVTAHKGVTYRNCTFDTDNYVYIVEFDGVSLENCNFTNGIDIYRSEKIDLVGCVIESKNNLFFQDARNITVRNCIIRNKCEINDNVHENRGTDDLSKRRCINLMRGYIHAFCNSYFFDDDSLENYDIAFDAHMNASGFQSKIDTSKILQENNAEYKILKSGIILEENYSIYNLACFDVGNIIMKKDGTIMIKNNNGWKKLQYTD